MDVDEMLRYLRADDATVRADDEGEIFWPWLARHVSAERYAEYRVQPLAFVKALHVAAWSIFIENVVTAQQGAWVGHIYAQGSPVRFESQAMEQLLVDPAHRFDADILGPA